MIEQGFETRSVRMERAYLLVFQAPAQDVDRILAAVTPLTMDSYDSHAWHSAPGIELDDSANPNRWWSTTGDWMKTDGQSPGAKEK